MNAARSAPPHSAKPGRRQWDSLSGAAAADATINCAVRIELGITSLFSPLCRAIRRAPAAAPEPHGNTASIRQRGRIRNRRL